jgi:hypothetical protein
MITNTERPGSYEELAFLRATCCSIHTAALGRTTSV